MTDYISRDAVCYQLEKQVTIDGQPRAIKRAARIVADFPAADVLPRDEAIKMGAELVAMHGSDATSQQLEEAYLKGVEYGMTRRDVRPVVRGKWEDVNVRDYSTNINGGLPLNVASMFCPVCKRWHNEVYHYGNPTEMAHYCPNCGAWMDGDGDV